MKLWILKMMQSNTNTFRYVLWIKDNDNLYVIILDYKFQLSLDLLLTEFLIEFLIFKSNWAHVVPTE